MVPVDDVIDQCEFKPSAASAEFWTEAEPVTLAKVEMQLPRGAVLVELVTRRASPRIANVLAAIRDFAATAATHAWHPGVDVTDTMYLSD